MGRFIKRKTIKYYRLISTIINANSKTLNKVYLDVIIYYPPIVFTQYGIINVLTIRYLTLIKLIKMHVKYMSTHNAYQPISVFFVRHTN